MLHLVEYKDNSLHSIEVIEHMYISVFAKTPGIAKAPNKSQYFPDQALIYEIFRKEKD